MKAAFKVLYPTVLILTFVVMLFELYQHIENVKTARGA